MRLFPPLGLEHRSSLIYRSILHLSILDLDGARVSWWCRHLQHLLMVDNRRAVRTCCSVGCTLWRSKLSSTGGTPSFKFACSGIAASGVQCTQSLGITSSAGWWHVYHPKISNQPFCFQRLFYPAYIINFIALTWCIYLGSCGKHSGIIDVLSSIYLSSIYLSSI